MNRKSKPAVTALLGIGSVLAAVLSVQAADKTASDASEATVAQVQVYKPNGSVQCESGGAIPLQQMGSQLTDAGIVVHAARKADDGLMRPAVCGAGTGAINVYDIDAGQLDTALAQGFRVLPQ